MLDKTVKGIESATEGTITEKVLTAIDSMADGMDIKVKVNISDSVAKVVIELRKKPE